ncbi:hypothetical protein pb186bvf_007863 [Paramecium bursaria]
MDEEMVISQLIHQDYEEPSQTKKTQDFFKTRLDQVKQQLAEQNHKQIQQKSILKPIILDNIAEEVVKRCQLPSSYICYRKYKDFLPKKSRSTTRERTSLFRESFFPGIQTQTQIHTPELQEQQPRITNFERVIQLNKQLNNWGNAFKTVCQQQKIKQNEKVHLKIQLLKYINNKDIQFQNQVKRLGFSQQLNNRILDDSLDEKQVTQEINNIKDRLEYLQNYCQKINEYEKLDNNYIKTYLQVKRNNQIISKEYEIDEIQKYKKHLDSDTKQIVNMMKSEKATRHRKR